jgi:hypothetical protein
MAYADTQLRLIAREVARAGGNVEAAVRACRGEYESLRSLGGSTVRRYMKTRAFSALLDEEREILHTAQRQAAEEAERRKILAELQGTALQRQQLDEQIADELRDTIMRDLQDGGGLTTAQRVSLFEKLTRIIDRRREHTMPAVAGFAEGQMLIQAVADVLRKSLPERAGDLVAQIRDRYRELQEMGNGELGMRNAAGGR